MQVLYCGWKIASVGAFIDAEPRSRSILPSLKIHKFWERWTGLSAVFGASVVSKYFMVMIPCQIDESNSDAMIFWRQEECGYPF